MTISYKWLSEYLPVTVEPDRLSRILTSIGVEVESMNNYEEVKGGLQGLLIGEVLSTEKHPNADKLTLTTVDINAPTPLQIVCGAPNVAVGQKVVIAKVGTTIYPVNTDPVTMQQYLQRIRDLENLALAYQGVEKAYAIQAGRELRVIVEAEKVTDADSDRLSFEIAQKIQNEMTFPGQIKVTVIREKRAVNVAR